MTWEDIKASTKRLNSDIIDLSREHAAAKQRARKVAKHRSLGDLVLAQLRELQNTNLISRIYRNAGKGTGPVSGGKVEGRGAGRKQPWSLGMK